MMRKRITISSIFLMCLLALSFVSLSFGNYASAYDVAAYNFLPNHYESSVDTANEVQLSQSIAAYISSELSKKYPTKTRYDCTKSTYLNDLDDAQNYDKVVTYSKGHRSRDGVHFALVTKGGDNLRDYEIFPETHSYRNVVTFIWHCQTAEDYTPNGNNNEPSGAKSMPYAWSHNNNLVKYGSSGTQVYLGWTGRNNLMIYNMTSNQYEIVTTVHPDPLLAGLVGSPQYEWGFDPNHNYAQVAELYWYYMSKDYTTTAALNQMSYTVFFNLMPFAYSPLNDWLIVYGNGDVKLPTDSGHRFVSSIAPGSPTNIGSGYVSNAPGIIGNYADGNLAYINGINSGAGGHIVGELNGVARGTVWVYAASVHGYNTRLQVFVSNDNVNWVSMGSKTITGGTGWQWVNFGTYNSDFKYVGIAAMNQYGYEPANVYIDLSDVTR